MFGLSASPLGAATPRLHKRPLFHAGYLLPLPRFAANLTLMFAERHFLDRFAAARSAGFDAVECQFPYEHEPEALREALEREGLELALFNLSPGNWSAGDRGLAALPSRRDEFEASVGVAIAYAEALDVKRLHLMAGLADPAEPAAREAYRDALARACDAAGEIGAGILIEPLNGRDAPGYFLRDFEFAAELIEGSGLSNLKLQFDVYHRQIIRGDVIRGLETLMPLIGHVQVASVPDRHEPGSGELDDEKIFAALDRIGYRGFVGCEYRPAGRTEDGLGWFERHRRDPR